MNVQMPSIEDSLLAKNGELMTGECLRRSMGYRSERSFARAVKDGTVPVPLISLPGRRGWFARTRDVADWLKNLTAGAPAEARQAARLGGGAMQT
jgi:hypothetical protein